MANRGAANRELPARVAGRMRDRRFEHSFPPARGWTTSRDDLIGDQPQPRHSGAAQRNPESRKGSPKALWIPGSALAGNPGMTGLGLAVARRLSLATDRQRR
jgi:hypothetical protein